MERTVNKSNEKQTVEIWIRGRKLCDVEDMEVLEHFEQIVRKAEYNVKTIHDDINNKIIKVVYHYYG